ncbi:MAG: hypothetical protein SOZ78_02580 [Eubacteriales bacterium]|nr:hypothetical protein [Eubacteriales bacterium]
MKNILKTLFKSKKGSAIEMAMAASIVVFSMCTILLAVTMMASKNELNTTTDYINMTQADQIAEEYMNWLNMNTADRPALFSPTKNPDEKFTVNANTETLLIMRDGRTVLTVTLKKVSLGDDKYEYKVSSWKYSG